MSCRRTVREGMTDFYIIRASAQITIPSDACTDLKKGHHQQFELINHNQLCGVCVLLKAAAEGLSH